MNSVAVLDVAVKSAELRTPAASRSEQHRSVAHDAVDRTEDQRRRLPGIGRSLTSVTELPFRALGRYVAEAGEQLAQQPGELFLLARG